MASSKLRLVTALVIALLGAGSLIWAFLRDYPDLQRLYGLGIGWLLVIVATVLVLTTLAQSRK